MWCERYQVYAAAHGFTCDEMLTYDRERWPGASMAGYVLWINAKWSRYCRRFNVNRNFKTEKTHENFNNWLKFYNGRPI